MKIYLIIPLKSDIKKVKQTEIATFLQQYKQFIKTDTSYLQQLNKNYYFVVRIRDRVVKYSLKSSNLKYCNIIKLKLLRFINEEYGLEKLLNNFHKNKIMFIEDNDDNTGEVEKLKDKIRKITSEEVANCNLKRLDIDDSKSITIKEAIKKFLDYKENVDKVKEATLTNF